MIQFWSSVVVFLICNSLFSEQIIIKKNAAKLIPLSGFPEFKRDTWVIQSDKELEVQLQYPYFSNVALSFQRTQYISQIRVDFSVGFQVYMLLRIKNIGDEDFRIELHCSETGIKISAYPLDNYGFEIIEME